MADDAVVVLERYAAHLGIPVQDPPAGEYPMWDGRALSRPGPAEDWAHEIAHWLLATPDRRRLVDYGWGSDYQFVGRDYAAAPAGEDWGLLPWPDPGDAPGEQEEVLACMLGFSFLVRLGVDATDLYEAWGFYWCDGDVWRLEPNVPVDRRKVQSHVVGFVRWLGSQG